MTTKPSDPLTVLLRDLSEIVHRLLCMPIDLHERVHESQVDHALEWSLEKLRTRLAKDEVILQEAWNCTRDTEKEPEWRIGDREGQGQVGGVDSDCVVRH